MNDTTNDEMNVQYHVDTGPLFGLALKTTMLTVITLGIYRFWARTRIRRYIWSAVRPGGDEIEYTGTGLEKFLGFLIAVVVLAVYLGILQVLLMFLGFNVLGLMTERFPTEAEMMMQIAVPYITLLALAPLIFFAQYRGRRYMMSRTRWRGVRFAMDQAAWGYVWRGLLYSLLTIISLGLLMPLATFKLEKYMTDRTWYGDAKLVQGGRWTMLYKAMVHVILSLVLLVVAGGLIGFGASGGNEEFAILGGVLVFAAYLYLIYAFYHYGVQSFNMLTNTKTLDDKVTFRSEAKTWSVIGLTLLGMLILTGISMGIGLVLAIVGGIAAVIFATVLDGGGSPSMMMIGPAFFAIAILYIVLLAVMSAGAIAFIAAPVLGHYVNNLTILGAPHLDTVKQRVGDDIADADGFADALDIGGAF